MTSTEINKEVKEVKEVKVFTFDELKSLTSKSDLHMLISGKVYAIAKFLDEHPGGDEVLFGEAGRDATEAFEDVGHSDEARELLAKYLVGDGPEGTAPKETKKVRTTSSSEAGSSFTYLLPLAGLVGYLAYRFYETKTAIV